MKRLKNHMILYDAECPLCQTYTGWFVKGGMLDGQGRQHYQAMPAAICPLVDKQRAMNEIALVNVETGDVTYGVSSLFKIISNSFPIFKPLFSAKPFIWLMSKLYSFISYNRKVIIPPATATPGMQPAFRFPYRLAYLLFTVLLSSYILTLYAPLFAAIVPPGGPLREYFVCGGQVFFQVFIISFAYPKKLWDYLGNMMTISFAASLTLLPVIAVSKFLSLPQEAYLFYFLSIAGCMLLEHIRRSKLLSLGWTMTITWLLYRVGVIVVIFFLKP